MQHFSRYIFLERSLDSGILVLMSSSQNTANTTFKIPTNNEKRKWYAKAWYGTARYAKAWYGMVCMTTTAGRHGRTRDGNADGRTGRTDRTTTTNGRTGQAQNYLLNFDIEMLAFILASVNR